MNCVVVAYKFNDVLYAINTEEYKESSRRVLIVFFARMPHSMRRLFDEVLVLNYERNVLHIMRNLVLCRWRLGTKFFADPGVYISSNYQLLNTRLFFSLLCRRFDGVYVEDGFMSYMLNSLCSDGSSVEKIPRPILLAFGISRSTLLQRIKNSYFFVPDLIKWIENPCELTLDLSIGSSDEAIRIANDLNGRAVFAGQPIYEHYKWYSKEAYIAKVNSLYNEGLIEWYLPHPQEKEDVVNRIACPIYHMGENFLSFESVAPLIKNISIFTYFSSLAYTGSILSGARIRIVRDFAEDERFHGKVFEFLELLGVEYSYV